MKTLFLSVLLCLISTLLSAQTESFVYDLGIDYNTTLIPSISGENKLLFDGFEVGLKVYNQGTLSQDSVYVHAIINGPLGIEYNETLGPIQIASGDTLSILPTDTISFPAYNSGGPGNYPEGDYVLNYEVYSVYTDENTLDNNVSSQFSLEEYHLTIARRDANDKPVANTYPDSALMQYQSCFMFVKQPNTSLCVSGLYFVPHTDTTVNSLVGAEIFVNAYSWDDVWIDLNDTSYSFAPNSNEAFQNLSLITFGIHYVASNNELDQPSFGQFNTPFQLVDYQRYLFCAQTYEADIVSFGYDSLINFSGNVNYSATPIAPILIDTNWYINGWGNQFAPSLGLETFDCYGGLSENTISFTASPNPVTDIVTLSSNSFHSADVNILDVSGRVVLSTSHNFLSGDLSLNLSGIESGIYYCSIQDKNGSKTQVTILKE